jgi:glycosyltransferase involved in cell wall biosynthesis
MGFKKVKYVDTFSVNTLHDQFNASFLATCIYTFGNVEYFVGKSSYKNTQPLLSKLPDLSYTIKIIWIPKGKSRYALLFRTVISALRNIKLLIFSKSEDLLIYNSNNFFSLYFINSLNRRLNRNIIIVCHSELAFIKLDCVHNNFIYDLRTRILRSFFKSEKVKISDKLNFCVLGDSILSNLSKYIPEDKIRHFISIDHPYIFIDKSIKRKIVLSSINKIKIGVIGTMAQEKGADILVEIAKKLDLKNNEHVSIEIIGKILCDTIQFVENGIMIPEDKGRDTISRTLFDQKINALDYVLYLYPTDSYKFTASGSVMDAINYEIPIISFKNDFFTYIFQKYGCLGYLFNNVDELVDKLKILDKHESFNFKNTKVSLSPLMISKKFKQEFSEIEKNDNGKDRI